MQWRPLSYVPNLRRAIGKRESAQGGALELNGLPSGWQGVLSGEGERAVTHVGRFFEHQKTLAEIVLVWPLGRDTQLERRVLGSVLPVPVREGTIRWDAMGIGADLPDQYSMTGFRAEPAHSEWTFKGRDGVTVTIARLGMPKYWLKVPLADWLAEQAPRGWCAAPAGRTTMNGHEAWDISTHGPTQGIDRLLGRRTVAREIAWHCPAEDRVYRVRYHAVIRGATVAMPVGLKVDCCRPLPVGGVGIEAATGKPGERADALEGVPLLNSAANIERRPDGTALAEIAMRRPRFLVPPISWILPYSDRRRVLLDALGVAILGLCDGKRTIGAIVSRFAAENKLTFREAQVAVVQFLRQLTERGVIVVAGAEGAGSA